MANFSPFELLKILTPRMIARGLIYPCRAAFHVTRSGQPDLRGLAFWRAVAAWLLSPPEPARPPLEAFSFPGDVTAVEAGERGAIIIRAGGGALRVLPLAPDLLQIRVSPAGVFPEAFSYSLEKPESAWLPVEMSVRESDSQIELSTGRLTLVIEKSPCRLSLRDGDGLLFEEIEGVGHHAPDGQIVWRAALDEDTAFYGLGEKASRLNLAGQRFELWNFDPGGYDRGDDPLYMSIPFLLALSGGRALGLFFDNPYRTWVDLGTETPGLLEYRAVGGEFRLYLMVGTPAEVLERYTELTGRTKLPPLWALGFHQSRWSYYPQDRVLEIAREFRERRLPCDVIHLDIHYMDDYRCFTWNRDRFPAPREMLADLREKGFRAMAIIDPGIKVDDQYAVYREGVRRDVFVKYPDGTRFTGPVWPGDCHFPDFTDPEVRAWWGELYRGLLEDGLSAFWNDMNEPALITVRPEYASVPDVVRHDAEGRGADHAEMHNLYGMLMVRASAEGLRRLQPDRRPLILTRSGWAGVQRYALHWTGDNASTWDHLRLSIQMVLNLGLSGIPITGPDVGGFTGGPGPELYARWMQVGAFMPFFRVHSMSGSPDQEPWAFGPEVEAISRRYLELRYRLLPYLYTAVWQASRTGIPVARAMSFVYPADPHTPGLDTQYLFGDSFLVAPVLEQGATSRPVYLPPGTWYDFWTGQQYHGGQTISVAAPLETLPLFVRAGSVIPLWPVQQHVGEKVPAPLTLAAYWAPGEHSSLLYEDDGLCANYESPEAHRLSRFVLRGGEEGTIGALVRLIEQGEYQPPASPAVLRLVGMSRPPSAIMLEGGTLINWEYSPETRSLQVEFDAPREFTLSLR